MDSNVSIDEKKVDWNDNDTEADVKKLQEVSELRYITIVEDIVKLSSNQLVSQQEKKIGSRESFQKFFIWLLIGQMSALIILIIAKAIFKDFNLTDKVIITFITSIFVETLAVVGIMIKFNFDSSQEVQILKILNGVVEKFQKFGK